MINRYQLMRKNDLITYVDTDEMGSMVRFAEVRTKNWLLFRADYQTVG